MANSTRVELFCRLFLGLFVGFFCITAALFRALHVGEPAAASNRRAVEKRITSLVGKRPGSPILIRFPIPTDNAFGRY